ncbi:MAG: DUF115 domain-containing protein, partial [Gammaproteobacteria bacterium]|nr:DUF115 domain-containing protein [Gammaproteobacteria bacterium]
DYLKSIPIIAPSHINPMVFTLFGDARYYFKRENPIAQLFGTEDETVANGTPTCTNASIDVAMHLGFRNVYLFGMDFGFRNREKHHAAGSVYARNDIPAELKARRGFHPWELITVEGVHGDTIYTIATYFNAKRKAEHLIKDCLITYPDVRFHNCSDGAVIENSEWLSAEMLEARILEDEGVNADAKQKVMNFIFHPKAKALDTKVIASRQLFMRKKLEEVRDDVLMLIKDDYTDLRGFTNLVCAINAYVEHVLKSVEPGFYFFIRGTLRHFMHVGFTHMLGLSDEAARRQFYEDWRSTFSGVLEDIQGHFRQVICKPEFSLESDPWVRQTINEPETYYGAP